MWPGPYGNFGSRKYSHRKRLTRVKRMHSGLRRYIFYHHRPDPETPLEETMGALDPHRSGAARRLYVGHLQLPGGQGCRGHQNLRRAWAHRILIHQPGISMLDRWVEGAR
jgi:aryl-alcohol dehydrogenase-like predicted oxidoreductase